MDRLNMLNLIGVHECKLDAKNRVAMPSALKKQLKGAVDEGFVLKRSVFQKCIELYTMAEWDQVMAKLNKLNRFVKKNSDFIRIYTAGVRLIELDGNGRLLIPKELCQFAGIENELVMSASGKIIELWNKERYESIVNDEELDFGSLAEDVMGQFGTDDNDPIS